MERLDSKRADRDDRRRLKEEARKEEERVMQETLLKAGQDQEARERKEAELLAHEQQVCFS